MHIQIDTGSRLDQSGDTTFAFSNDRERAILLRQSVRDRCLEQIPGNKLERELRLFAACFYLLIQDNVEELEEITIDEEYPGHSGKIRGILLNIIKKRHPQVAEQLLINFLRIGRKSEAHRVAWTTYRKERRPDRTLKVQEILSVLLS